MSYVPTFVSSEQPLYLKIQISQIPSAWDELKLKHFLSSQGYTVSDVQMLKKDDPKSKGAAIVKFNKMQEGEKATKQLKEVAVDGMQPLVLKWAEGEKERLGVAEETSPKIQIDGLQKDCEEAMIKEIFMKYGQVTDVQIQNQGQSSISAIVSYTFKESCLLAIKNNHNKNQLGDRPLDVRFLGQPATIANKQYPDTPATEEGDPIRDILDQIIYKVAGSEEETNLHSLGDWRNCEKVGYSYHFNSVSFGSIIYSPDGSKEIITKEKYLNDLATFNSKKTGPPGANLFVFHLPNEHKDSDLMDLFSSYGNVISARVMTDPKTGKSKGFGFVSFDKQESAQKAKEAMDGHLIDKKKLSVTFKQGDGTPCQPLQYQWLPSIQQVQFDPFDV
ncbi:unnamed protein product (macronuclear) [Paramecium tetraurelia]|uniref:RRM domain-containing protein n=1 Tax=Paramecium tetraurelia TaxID=5888 RepID=A0C337_PARTE|nr:uncharacterized protein GSPATT00034682001 [Paramecium tetraurelia]CAK65204.1 unnamed protein product [Paramecium tetraurelia]|eukprot:XP_001432601.1 hypothetical protein (macronuclear) [Paramecium tetraurelia strain d4-2]